MFEIQCHVVTYLANGLGAWWDVLSDNCPPAICRDVSILRAPTEDEMLTNIALVGVIITLHRFYSFKCSSTFVFSFGIWFSLPFLYFKKETNNISVRRYPFFPRLPSNLWLCIVWLKYSYLLNRPIQTTLPARQSRRLARTDFFVNSSSKPTFSIPDSVAPHPYMFAFVARVTHYLTEVIIIVKNFPMSKALLSTSVVG